MVVIDSLGRLRWSAAFWLVLLLIGHPGGVWGWSKTLDGGGTNDIAEAVAVHPSGDVIAYGTIGRRCNGGGCDSIEKLVRFDASSGEEVWRSQEASDPPGALMVAPGGEIYGATFRGAILRFGETDGVALWGGSVAGNCSGYNTFSFFGGLAAHPSGDVVEGATGCLTDNGGARFTVGRLDKLDGSRVWSTQVEAANPVGIPTGYPSAVVADSAGDVVAVGQVHAAAPEGAMFTLVKFDGDSGLEQWRYTIPGIPGGSRADVVAVDSQDNIIAAGIAGGVLTVCKFDPTGIPLWNPLPLTPPPASEPRGCRQRFFLGDPTRVFQPNASVLVAAVDEDDNVIIGTSPAEVCTDGLDFPLVMKLDESTGSPVWDGLNMDEPTCPPFATQLDIALGGGGYRMVVGPDGDVGIAAGPINNETGAWVAKVSGETGMEVWSKKYPPEGEARDVAFDGSGNVFVGGKDTSRYFCRAWDMLVAKLHKDDGAVASSCGNNFENVDEECDDGNTDDGDGCSSGCTVEHGCCGDGVNFGIGEACDGGDDSACPAECQVDCTCPSPVCGNGTREGPEECDDGNSDDCDTCHNDCTSGLLAACGDAHACGSEECDDGNVTDGDGCDSTCRLTGCGSGVKTGDEQCDDGNNSDGDGCSSGCRWEEHCAEVPGGTIALIPALQQRKNVNKSMKGPKFVPVAGPSSGKIAGRTTTFAFPAYPPLGVVTHEAFIPAEKVDIVEDAVKGVIASKLLGNFGDKILDILGLLNFVLPPFTPDLKLFGNGNNRSHDSTFSPGESKVSLVLDFEHGRGWIMSNHTALIVDVDLPSLLPTVHVFDLGRTAIKPRRRWKNGDWTWFWADWVDGDHFRLRYEARNILPLYPAGNLSNGLIAAIDHQILIDRRTGAVAFEGDEFPSTGTYRYKCTGHAETLDKQYATDITALSAMQSFSWDQPVNGQPSKQ